MRRKRREAIPGELVDDGSGPEYVIEPLTRTQKLAFWVTATEFRWGVVNLVVALVFAIPFFFIGIWWGVIVVVGGLAFTVGWNSAYRAWLRDGRIDRL